MSHMKYEELKIVAVPKSFDIWDSVEYVQPYSEDMDPDDIIFDAYPAECDEDRGEEAIAMFKYNESATGIYIVHNPAVQLLTVWLSPFAVEADVRMYVSFVNSFLSKHKKARLFDKYAPLKSLTDEDAAQMVNDRNKYLKKLLTTKREIVLEGLNTSYVLTVAHLRPESSVEKQVEALQRTFVEMQWTFDEES